MRFSWKSSLRRSSRRKRWIFLKRKKNIRLLRLSGDAIRRRRDALAPNGWSPRVEGGMLVQDSDAATA